MIHRRHGVLPQLRLRHLRPEEPRNGPHVAMRQLVPGLRKRGGKLLRVVMETLGDFFVVRVHPQGHVGREHHGGMRPLWIVGIGHGALSRVLLWGPLPGSRRTLFEFPFVAEEVLEVAAGPLRRRGRPCPFKAARDRVVGIAFAEVVLPAEPLLFDVGCFRSRADMIRAGGTVRLSEGVPAGDQGHRFLVVHRHAGEGLPDIPRRGERIRFAIGPLRIDIDQPHLHGGQWVFELPIPAVTLVTEPLALGPPRDVFLRLPDIDATTRESECLEAHRLQGDVAGQNHQIGPGDPVAVPLLDRPQQPTRLVEVCVVGPTVERGEPLRAIARAASTVADAIGPGTVPGHPDEEWSVVSVIGRPPRLRHGHQLPQVPLQRLEIEPAKLRGIVEVSAQRICSGSVLMEDLQVQLIRPPVGIRHSTGCGIPRRSRWHVAHHRTCIR